MIYLLWLKIIIFCDVLVTQEKLEPKTLLSNDRFERSGKEKQRWIRRILFVCINKIYATKTSSEES